MQLVPIEDRGRGRHSLQLEFRYQLFAGEGLARSSLGAPAEQGKIICQRLGQNSHFAEAGHRGGAMTLGQPLAIAAQDGRKVGKLRQLPAEGLINGDLPGRV